jgi:hypothetical protein
MSHEVAGESTDELIILARTHGFRVSKHQLARWHRSGLLPLPQERRFLGRGVGSQTIYPAGTGVQLLALLEIHARERRLPYVAWLLWWEGYDSPIRRHVRKFLDRPIVFVEKALQSKIDPRDFEWRRLTERTVRRARRRIGRKHFPQFIGLILDAARGKEAQLDPREAELVEKGLALDNAREDRIKGAEPWLRGEIDDTLQSLGKALRPHTMRQNLRAADDQDLGGARDEVRSFLLVLKEFASIAKLIFGPHAFGLDIFRDIDASEPLVQAFFLLLWLDLRTHPPFKEARAELVSALPQPAEQRIATEGLVLLGREVPGLADILSERRLQTAIGDPEKAKAFNEQLKERLQQHRAEVAAFMQRHPQVQQAIQILLSLETR